MSENEEIKYIYTHEEAEQLYPKIMDIIKLLNYTGPIHITIGEMNNE